MISFKVCAIFRITDSFTEKPIANGIFSAKVDGIKTKLLSKDNGYFLLMDAENGEHELELESSIYLTEKVRFSVNNSPETHVITLKPGVKYPYSGNAKKFEGEAEGEYVWIAPVKSGAELKIAETKAESGSASVNVFTPASFSKHIYPDNFLISDGNDSEIICIEKIEDGKAEFIGNLKNNHKRGTKFLPAVKIEVIDGHYSTVFNNVENIEVYSE